MNILTRLDWKVILLLVIFLGTVSAHLFIPRPAPDALEVAQVDTPSNASESLSNEPQISEYEDSGAPIQAPQSKAGDVKEAISSATLGNNSNFPEILSKEGVLGNGGGAGSFSRLPTVPDEMLPNGGSISDLIAQIETLSKNTEFIKTANAGIETLIQVLDAPIIMDSIEAEDIEIPDQIDIAVIDALGVMTSRCPSEKWYRMNSISKRVQTMIDSAADHTDHTDHADQLFSVVEPKDSIPDDDDESEDWVDAFPAVVTGESISVPEPTEEADVSVRGLVANTTVAEPETRETEKVLSPPVRQPTTKPPAKKPPKPVVKRVAAVKKSVVKPEATATPITVKGDAPPVKKRPTPVKDLGRKLFGPDAFKRKQASAPVPEINGLVAQK